MKWSVIVPFRGDGAERSRNWEWCKARLEWQLKGVDGELIVADSGHSPFNRAASRNEGAARARGDLLMLIDADGANDNWIEAGEEVSRHAGWTICYQEPDGYVALTKEVTEHLLTTSPDAPLEEVVPGAWYERVHSYAGCIVVRAKEFRIVRGYDARFQGWGYEDDAFREVMETVVGPARRVPGDHVHLWHPHVESERFRQPHIGENRNLANSYGAARGNREAMLRLVERR